MANRYALGNRKFEQVRKTLRQLRIEDDIYRYHLALAGAGEMRRYEDPVEHGKGYCDFYIPYSMHYDGILYPSESHVESLSATRSDNQYLGVLTPEQLIFEIFRHRELWSQKGFFDRIIKDVAITEDIL